MKLGPMYDSILLKFCPKTFNPLRKYTYLQFKHFFLFAMQNLWTAMQNFELPIQKKNCIAVLLCKKFGRNRSLITNIVHCLILNAMVLVSLKMVKPGQQQQNTDNAIINAEINMREVNKYTEIKKLQKRWILKDLSHEVIFRGNFEATNCSPR